MEQNSYYIFYLTDMRNRNILIANKIIKHRGAGTNRLRLRLDVSLTLIPDLDNASVGSAQTMSVISRPDYPGGIFITGIADKR